MPDTKTAAAILTLASVLANPGEYADDSKKVVELYHGYFREIAGAKEAPPSK